MPWLQRKYGKRKVIWERSHKYNLLLRDVVGHSRSAYDYCTKRQKDPDKYTELKEKICSIVAEKKEGMVTEE